jgi:outer membrane protein assembly factor BamA
LRLKIYNFADKYPDTTFNRWLNKKPKKKQHVYNFLSKKQTVRLQNTYSGINNWVKKLGEAPALIDSTKVISSIENLTKYYKQNGWYDINADYTIDYSKSKKGSITYNIETGPEYTIDSITYNIDSKTVDSIYDIHKKNSFIKVNSKYKVSNLVNERERINNIMRNSGIYTFEKESVSEMLAEYDSIKKTFSIRISIVDRKVRGQDSTFYEPYKIFKISRVNVFTDNSYNNRGEKISDSAIYNGHNFYSINKLRYKTKAISDAIFIKPNEIFKNTDKSLTLKQLNNLRTFKYPDIKYEIDEKDSTKTSLIANILLTPLKKFELENSIDASHNNIQDIGFSLSTSILARNVFKGAETLQLAFRGSVGASKDGADREDKFFDLREFGADLKLAFPKILFPVNTSRIIPKTMSPSTKLSTGASTQKNIGLDKTTFTGIMNYTWFSSAKVTNRLDLLNTQFVNNLNPGRYFEIYNNSYDKLNTIANNSGYTDENLSIPNGTEQFINDVLNNNLSPEVDAQISNTEKQDVSNIEERRQRLTENNLILTTNYSYTRNTRKSLNDNNFNRINVKLEFAGNTLSTLSNVLGLEKNSSDRFELFNVAYSQYVKTELDYIKYWSLSKNNTLAFRSFFGIAIPYGNSNSIPFSRSFFGGGSNDNRAWDAYSLGPGISGGQNEFNEANMKIALNAEYRYTLLGDLKGAFFIDAGNIWNVLDNEEDPEFKFEKLNDLSELAIGSGIGIRYDFGFFVLRFDIGFKTYEPYLKNKKWLRNYNFQNAVYNVGINYPF